MRHSTISPTLLLGFAVLGGHCLLSTGCSVLEPKADNTRLYVLRPQPPAAEAVPDRQPTRAVVHLGPDRLASYLDVTPVVILTGPNQVKQLDLHHWAEPLPKGISRVLAENLSQQLGGTLVSIYPEPANPTALEVRYSIDRLDGPLSGNLVLHATWQVLDPATGEVLLGAATAREIPNAGHTGDVADYVDRVSDAIAVLADEIAIGIKPLLAERKE